MALLAAGYLKTRRNEIEMSGNRKHFRELTTQHTYTYQPLAFLGPSAYQPGHVTQIRFWRRTGCLSSRFESRVGLVQVSGKRYCY